jgi:hypothetical protein
MPGMVAPLLTCLVLLKTERELSEIERIKTVTNQDEEDEAAASC